MRRIGSMFALGLFVTLHVGCDVAEQMATEQRVRLRDAAQQAIRDAAEAGKKAVGDAITGVAATSEATPAATAVDAAAAAPVASPTATTKPAAPDEAAAPAESAAPPTLKPAKPIVSPTDEFNTGAEDDFGAPDDPSAP